MESYGIWFLALLVVAETMPLHIVISPDEASKIMKRDDAFSKGLAGFIERTVSGSNHVKVTKREKINELKSLIQKALNDVDSKKYDNTKKESEEDSSAAPPALPLDAKTRKDFSKLETLVDKMLDEESQKAKRQGWIHYGKKKEILDTKEQLEKKVKEMDNSQEKLENIYQKVKRLVALAKGSKVQHIPPLPKKHDTVISDSGDVGSEMLKSVKKMIAEKKTKENQESGDVTSIAEELRDLTEKLSKKNIAPSDVGELSLNAIKRIIAGQAKKDQVKSHPSSKAMEKVTLDSIMHEVSDLLRKMKPKSGSKGEHNSDEVMKTDVAIEEAERPRKDRPRNVHSQRRKELMAKLIQTYDALSKENDHSSDAVEEELETLSSSAMKRSSNLKDKVSKETAEAIKGFDIAPNGKRRRSHPK